MAVRACHAGIFTAKPLFARTTLRDAVDAPPRVLPLVRRACRVPLSRPLVERNVRQHHAVPLIDPYVRRAEHVGLVVREHRARDRAVWALAVEQVLVAGPRVHPLHKYTHNTHTHTHTHTHNTHSPNVTNPQKSRQFLPKRSRTAFQSIEGSILKRQVPLGQAQKKKHRSLKGDSREQRCTCCVP